MSAARSTSKSRGGVAVSTHCETYGAVEAVAAELEAGNEDEGDESEEACEAEGEGEWARSSRQRHCCCGERR